MTLILAALFGFAIVFEWVERMRGFQRHNIPSGLLVGMFLICAGTRGHAQNLAAKWIGLGF